MTRLARRAEQDRRRRRALILVSLLGFTIAAVAFFVAGSVAPGLCVTVAGLLTMTVAARGARPANWSPEDHRESR